MKRLLTTWIATWAVTFYAASLLWVANGPGPSGASSLDLFGLFGRAFDVADAISPAAKLTLGAVVALGVYVAVLLARRSAWLPRVSLLVSPVLGAAAMVLVPAAGFPEGGLSAALLGGLIAGALASAAWRRPATVDPALSAA